MQLFNALFQQVFILVTAAVVKRWAVVKNGELIRRVKTLVGYFGLGLRVGFGG